MTFTKHGTGGLVCGLVACVLLASCDNGKSGLEKPTVAKVVACASGDHPEPGLQGQIPAAVRAAGFAGYNCNLTLEGQYAGTGGQVAFASFKDDQGHYCAYYSAAEGTNVVDITDPAKPVLTATLTTPAMLMPGETLRVNARRQLL